MIGSDAKLAERRSGERSQGPGWFLGRPRDRMQHLAALDGLRGFAVLVVIFSHLSNLGLLPQPGLSGTGKSGVYLFFVLSAFLLGRILLARSFTELTSAHLWADYFLRRVLRIWPLYLFILLSSWALTRLGLPWHYRIDDTALVRHLALREGQSVLWSIPVEFVFYFLLPPLVLAIACLRGRCSVWWQAGLACLMAALVMSRWPAAETAVNDVRLGFYLPVFLCGLLAARVDLALEARRIAGWSWILMALASVLIALLMVPSIWSRLTGSEFDPAVNHGWFLAHGLVWANLILALLHGPSWLRKPFEWAPMRLIGIVSFSAYLWHMPILEYVLRHGGGKWPVLGPVLVLALTLAVSMLSFLAFERPWRNARLASVKPASDTG